MPSRALASLSAAGGGDMDGYIDARRRALLDAPRVRVSAGIGLTVRLVFIFRDDPVLSVVEGSALSAAEATTDRWEAHPVVSADEDANEKAGRARNCHGDDEGSHLVAALLRGGAPWRDVWGVGRRKYNVR